MALLRTLGHKLRPSTHTKVRLPDKVAAPFYRSIEWRTLIAKIKRVRGDRCEDPTHRLEHPRSGVRLYGDHVEELKDGGNPLDPANVMLRCPPCHQRKTAQARAERYRGGGLKFGAGGEL